MPYYCLELRQNYQKNSNNNNINFSYFYIIRERNLNLLVSLNNTYKLYYSYKVIVANLYKNIKVIEYFNKYSLLSSKHLDFLD
ncbi:Intron-encoded DNA endonuclease aI3 [Saccharomyces cerevisiae]|nr:Intron-encoded DNA endonuclease aI3 [Saccharomyces cerevisiae]